VVVTGVAVVIATMIATSANRVGSSLRGSYSPSLPLLSGSRI
jgi:hypothetical protein